MMKAWPVIVLILVGLAVGAGGVYYEHEASIMRTPSLCRGSDSIRSHVYNPARLQTVNDCVTVSGTVDSVMAEYDGDYRVWFHVDPRYASLPNSANNDYRQGDLLAEIICASTVNQQDA